MAMIEGPCGLANMGNVYISDTSMYLIFRSSAAMGTGRLGNIGLPRGSTGTIFTGTVEIVSHVDEHEVNIPPLAVAGQPGQCLNSYAGTRLFLQIGDAAPPSRVGDLTEITFRLGPNAVLEILDNIPPPVNVRCIILRMRGKFYLTTHGYGAMQACTSVSYPNVDSWNHGLDGLNITMLTLREFA